ncbi:MAG TPA: PRC-barrel domain-containing protein [Candidatus Binatia bacterium]|nr:PRC-barrel domain-containing protein [Candidatus Binatia bacterium]
MKKTIAWMAAAMIAAPLAGSVRADDASMKDRIMHPLSHGKEAARPAAGPEMASYIPSDSIVGSQVRDTKGEDLGKIDKLLMTSDGKVHAAVISLGGVFGVGGRKVEVPWSAMSMRREKNDFVMTASRDTLDKAPAYDETRTAAKAGSQGTMTSSAPHDARNGGPDRPD